METPAHLPSPAATAALLPCTVLVADDDDLLREVLQEALETAVERVLVAANGPAALRVLAAAGHVDLLVTDIMMPGLNGCDLARLCRERDASMKVVFISGSEVGDIPVDERTMFLRKPVFFDDLVGAVRSMLAEHVG